MSGGKRFLRRFALAVLALIVGLLVAELALRVFVPSLGSRSFVDPSLGWSTREYRSFHPGRDPVDLDVPRILVLGDSYMADAYQKAGVDCRFPAEFERRVDSRVQTAVLSSSGWGTDQQLLAFVEKGKDWRPDVVLLAFCANNDLSDILSNNQGPRADKPYFLLEDGELDLRDPFGRPRSLLGTAAEEAGFQSFLYDMLRIRLGTSAEGSQDRFQRVDPRYLQNRVGRDPTIEGGFWEEGAPNVLDYSLGRQPNGISAFIHEDLEMNTYQWELFTAILAELERQANGIGARLALMIVPVTLVPRRTDMLVGTDYERRFETPDGAFSIRTREPVERLRAIAARLEIPFWDPSAEFRERVVSENLEEACWPDPGNRHFSCLGHAILADSFGDFLADGLGLDVR